MSVAGKASAGTAEHEEGGGGLIPSPLCYDSVCRTQRDKVSQPPRLPAATHSCCAWQSVQLPS